MPFERAPNHRGRSASGIFYALRDWDQLCRVRYTMCVTAIRPIIQFPVQNNFRSICPSIICYQVFRTIFQFPLRARNRRVFQGFWRAREHDHSFHGNNPGEKRILSIFWGLVGGTLQSKRTLTKHLGKQWN